MTTIKRVEIPHPHNRPAGIWKFITPASSLQCLFDNMIMSYDLHIERKFGSCNGQTTPVSCRGCVHRTPVNNARDLTILIVQSEFSYVS